MEEEHSNAKKSGGDNRKKNEWYLVSPSALIENE